MTWAVKQRLPSNQKLVLLMLADRTNRDTGRCTPSHRNLAEDCGMSMSTLKRCLAALQQAGLIEITNRSDGDVSLANQYQLNITGGWVHSEPTQSKTSEEPVQDDPPQVTVNRGWGHSDLGGGVTVTYKPGSNNQEVEPKDPPPARACARAKPPKDPPVSPAPQPPPWLARDLEERREAVAAARAGLEATDGRAAFAMHPGWRPGPMFAERCAMAGVSAEHGDAQLGEFVSYWQAEGAVARQSQWEHRFLKHLRREAAQLQGDPNGARRSGGGPCRADIVHDTSWLDADTIAYVESGLELARRGRSGEPGV